MTTIQTSSFQFSHTLFLQKISHFGYIFSVLFAQEREKMSNDSYCSAYKTLMCLWRKILMISFIVMAVVVVIQHKLKILGNYKQKVRVMLLIMWFNA